MAKQYVLINSDRDDLVEHYLVGPFTDGEAADGFIEEFQAIYRKAVEVSDSPDQIAYVVDSPSSPDEVFEALKANVKAVRKSAKKAAKKEAKKGKKKGKKQGTVAEAIESNGGPEAKKDNGNVLSPEEEAKRAELYEKARKQPWAGKLAENKDELIAEWAKALLDVEVLKPLELSLNQRRVIAALKWDREVANSNAHMPATVIQPPPIVGVDANGRVVVQQIESNGDGPRQWAVYKNGNPADIKEPVTRLKATASENL